MVTVVGDRVYDAIPDDLQAQWQHVQVEAAMRSKLQEATAEAALLEKAPKTHEQIERWLRDLEERVVMDDIFNMMFGGQKPPGPS